jgi:hypothetical protein
VIQPPRPRAIEPPIPVAPPRAGHAVGPVPITAVNVLIALTFVGASIFIAYVVLAIEVDQIPLLASGFAVLGASLVAIAVSAVVALWRAASRARAGRALALAIVGGVAGLGAIGCFTITALGLLVWRS